MAVTNSNKNNVPFLVEGVKDAYVTRIIPTDSTLKTFKTIRVPVTNNLQSHLDYDGRSRQFVLNNDGRTLTIYKRNLNYVPLVDSKVKDNNDNITSNKKIHQSGYSMRRNIPSSLLSNQSIDVKVGKHGDTYFNFRGISSDVVENAIRDLYRTAPPKPDPFIYNQPANNNNNPISQSNITNTNNSINKTNNNISLTTRDMLQKDHPFQNNVTIKELSKTKNRNLLSRIHDSVFGNIYTDDDLDDKVDLYIYPIVNRNFYRMSPETALKLMNIFNNISSNSNNNNVDTLYSVYKLPNTQSSNGGFYNDRNIIVSNDSKDRVYTIKEYGKEPVVNAYLLNKSYLDSINKNYKLLPLFSRYEYDLLTGNQSNPSAPVPISSPKFGEKSSFTKLRNLRKELIVTPFDSINGYITRKRLGDVMTINMPDGTKFIRAIDNEFSPIY